MAMQADELELGVGEHLAHRVGRVPRSEGEAELLVLHPGRHRRVRLRVDARGNPDQHPLAPSRQGGEANDFRGRVDHDPPDAVTDRGLQVIRRLGVPVQHDPVSGEPHRTGHGEFARRAHVQRQALLGDPFGHGAAQERLGGVGDLRAGQRVGVGPAPGPDVGLVEDVGGRAVPRGQRAQPQAADRDVAVGFQPRRARPQVSGQAVQADRVWRGRGAVPQSGIESARRPRPATSPSTRAVDATSVPRQPRRLVSTTPRWARSRHSSLSS